MNNLVLAYLGDAVYELYVREKLIEKGICKVKDLQNESIKYVSANSQVEILEKLMEDRKSTRLNSSHRLTSRMPSSA